MTKDSFSPPLKEFFRSKMLNQRASLLAIL